MATIARLSTMFTEFAPDQLEEGVLYLCSEGKTALHRCACGCGLEVVTPLGDGGWQIFVEGDEVSLSPSIGNFQFPCQSHYFIERNVVRFV